ncbi:MULTISPECIES: BTAD domain-containing putative transcriptional regulator [unclassified Mesorhizobium]|uniref:BTAD domain-containing putative transcriptional regulator n=2 Tax=Mesorhizobium TaxID=68287 RepID=UPI000FCC374E|nr:MULTISPECIES: BTAD domain-containing putative transcriptional regulator [unclassified Mesorhizobium]RUX72672.1 transcriptional regulator [Mesorhizobium sp. M7A.F.Ca.US.005.03.1.1]RUY10237.1 transcriptional regulator [Mesorhizobium sp. M7A.F.Ca.US.005.03.2.1]RUY28963.1 transcriptional regulator [Mesorhizobium sp. M7A.F.Ca.US.001.04.2.1]RUY41465.1 transcriptional regulator [Mesorhizobium sp. M7A.F.Ca.US.001.04.1.1]RVA02275.1 transcriptional regulator [Mesorhizobium sp. M7A.F.Ca.US.001.02.1.1]
MQSEDSGAANRISLFGGFRIENETAGPLRLTGKRGPAIIAYLARCPGMAATRERLADLLWGDSDAEHSRNSLRQALSVLRQDLAREGVDLIHSSGELIALRPELVQVDAEKFETGLSARSAQELAKALANYTGPFLDGLYLGSNAFDDWITSERDRLLGRALESFEKLARLVDPDAGLILADRILTMEPTREESYRLKMELLLACGQRDRAIRTYEACRSMLKKEFGVEAGPETRALWQSLLLAADDASNVQSTNGVPSSQRLGRPSISVADFVNLTGKQGDDFFAKGLVQDITTALSGVADYVVLAALPSEKSGPGEEAKTPGILRARYMLSGSVQRSGNGLRVNVQLVDAAGGHHVWAQKFDGHSENALEFQDRIAQSVVLAVILELQLTNWKVRDKSPPGIPEVRRLVNEALMKYFEMTRDSLLVGIELAEKAFSIGPDNARAKRTLSIVISMGVAFGALPRERGVIERAVELAEAAVRAVPDDEIARCILSFALESCGRIDEAIAECRHAISLNPSYPTGHGDISMLFALRGQVDEAVREANEAIRLGTHDVIDFWRHHGLVVALFAGGDNQRALEAARKVVRTKPGFVRGALYWAATASATGNNEEASRAIHHCLSQLPHLNLSNVCPGFVPRYVKDHHHSRFLEMLSRAGLPSS